MSCRLETFRRSLFDSASNDVNTLYLAQAASLHRRRAAQAGYMESHTLIARSRSGWQLILKNGRQMDGRRLVTLSR